MKNVKYKEGMKRGLIILILSIILFLNIPNINASPADLNSDNKVNATDIQLIIRWILGIDQTNPATDMDNNGQVNIFDLVNASRLFGKIYGSDSIAPTIISSSPSSNLSSGVTSAILFAKTDERATCKYLNSSSGNYSVNMTTFTRTGGVSHSTTLTGLANGTLYNYYVQCQDEAGNLNSTNYNIGFGVNNSFAAPDIYSWGFEGATDDIASGSIITGSGINPFITGFAEWTRDTVNFHSDNQSAQCLISGNVDACQQPAFNNFTNPNYRTHLFVRFWYKLDPNYNLTEAANAKFLRFTQPGWTGNTMGFNIGVGCCDNYKLVHYGAVQNIISPNQGVSPTPVPTQTIGVWTCYEVEADWSDYPNSTTGRIWRNDTLIIANTLYGNDSVDSNQPNAYQLGALNFFGTADDNDGKTLNMDDVAISTQRIGC